jgi:AmmeMemoRadiSam system protein B
MMARRETRPTVRPSAIAGSWYPGSQQELRRMLQGFFSQVPTRVLDGRLIGLIAPHAGYVYSGPTAAFAYRQLEGKTYDTVVVISPNHRAYWPADFVVSTATHYETPLGLVPVDRPFVEQLARQVDMGGAKGDSEHSLEIQLPFLQYMLPDFDLVPIMVNTNDPAAARRLGEALATVITGSTSSVLLVASTDLHHIPDYDEVVRRDNEVVTALASFDMVRIEKVLMRPDCSVCGRLAVLAVLQAARGLGADGVEILHQTNSGDVTGIRSPGQYTVGYMAAAVVASS